MFNKFFRNSTSSIIDGEIYFLSLSLLFSIDGCVCGSNAMARVMVRERENLMISSSRELNDK
jgi:hypothetical protein